MKILFRIYQWLIAAPIFIVVTFFTAIITMVGTLCAGTHFWGYYPAHLWSKFVCRLMFVMVNDIFSIYGYLNHNFKWLMKKELEKIFMVGPACKRAGHVFVDDSNIRSIKETISEAEEKLRGGMSLVIFPEGSRTWDGKMIPFKRGAFMLASEFNLPVVPISIDGSFKAMPRFTYNVTPTTITLTIHKPFYPGEKGFNTRQLMNQCREVIASAVPEENQEIPSEVSK